MAFDKRDSAKTRSGLCDVPLMEVVLGCILQRSLVHGQICCREAAKHNLPEHWVLHRLRPHRSHSDWRCSFDGEPVDAGADAWKRDGSNRALAGSFERLSIAGREQLGFIVGAAAPNGPDRMNDVLGREAIAPCDFGLSGLATAEQTTLVQQIRACGAMNGTVDAAATEQRRIGSIDDGVDLERRDVSANGAHDLWHMRPNAHRKGER